MIVEIRAISWIYVQIFWFQLEILRSHLYILYRVHSSTPRMMPPLPSTVPDAVASGLKGLNENYGITSQKDPRVQYSAWVNVSMTWSIRGYIDYPVGHSALKITSACHCARFQKGKILYWLPGLFLNRYIRCGFTRIQSYNQVSFINMIRTKLSCGWWKVQLREGCGLVS